jgi:hypothetical protein
VEAKELGSELTFPLPEQTRCVRFVQMFDISVRLYQSLGYRSFANVNVGTDTAVRETGCTTRVVTLVLQSVVRGRGVARTQFANGGAGHFHTKVVFIVR